MNRTQTQPEALRAKADNDPASLTNEEISDLARLNAWTASGHDSTKDLMLLWERVLRLERQAAQRSSLIDLGTF